MAKTPAQFKQEYEKFDAETIKGFSELLKLLKGTDAESTERWTALAVAFLLRRRTQASRLAQRQYSQYRNSLNVPGRMPQARGPRPLESRRLEESLKTQVLVPFYQADRLASELSEDDSFLETSIREEANRRALVQGAGTASRYAQEAYLTQMEDLSDDDPESSRFRRIPSADACWWCLMLSTRGAVYISADTALSSHDLCRCSALPDFGANDSPEEAKAEELWKSVEDDGFTGKKATEEFKRRAGGGKTRPPRKDSGLPTLDSDGRNSKDADVPTERLQRALAALEKSLEKFDSKASRSRIDQLRAELATRNT